MLASSLALALILQSPPDALVMAGDLCVEAGGDFKQFERLGSARGDRLENDQAQAFVSELRAFDHVAGYRTGDVVVTLANLPGGVQTVPSPIQNAGQPTRMWDYDFPHQVVCRVVAPTLPGNWEAVIDGWSIGGSPLSPLRTGQSSEKSWLFPNGGFVRVQTPADKPSQIDIVFEKNR